MTASGTNYRPDIDGLRALAVLPVVFYHAGFQTFSGGYVGVDVFFVISGFLITSIILPEVRAGQFRFRRFYERRARRLFPALFVVLAFCCVPAYWLLMPHELEDFGQSLATTALFGSNFLFWSESGYFEGPAELKPLLHTWSLAIEEQYYLLFPLLLLLTRRRLAGDYLRVTLLIVAASLALSIWSVSAYPRAAFFLLPSRTWELLLGSVLALTAPPRLAPLLANVLGFAGLGLIALAVFGFHQGTPFPGLAALLPCVGTALVITVGRHTPVAVNRLLGLQPLVFVGLISYSLYLWHWPLLVFARHFLVRPLTFPESLVLVAAAVVCAVLSWRYVERPFRGGRGFPSARGVFHGSLAVIVGAVVIGLVFDESEGLPGRLPAQVAVIARVADDKPPERARCEGIAPEAVSFARLCRITAAPVPPSFIVWGDSHAAALMRAVRSVAAERGLNGLNATSNGCAPLLGVTRPVRDLEGECLAFNHAVLELIGAHRELETVVLSARWARHAEAVPFGEESAEPYFLRDDRGIATSTEENHDIFAEGLERTLTALHEFGRRVVVLGPVPEVGWDVPNVLAKARWHGRAQQLDLPRLAFEQRQAFVLPLFADLRQRLPFEFLPLHEYFCDTARCRVTHQGLPLYFDDDHPSSLGAGLTRPAFEQIWPDVGDAAGAADTRPRSP